MKTGSLVKVLAGMLLVLACTPMTAALADDGSPLTGGTSVDLTTPTDEAASEAAGGAADGVGDGAPEAEAAESVDEPAEEPAPVVVRAPKKKAKIAEGAYTFNSKLNSSLKLGLTGKTAEANVQAAAKRAGEKTACVFYVRPEGKNRYSIQVVSTGLFLTEVDGKVVLRKWAGTDKQLWWAASNSGVTFVNTDTGDALAVSKNKAKSGAKIVGSKFSKVKGQRWSLSSSRLVSDGWYRLRSSLGTYLNVGGGGYKSGATVNAREKTDNGSQCFWVGHVGSSYRIENARSFESVAVANASKKNKANVVQLESSASESKLWKIGIDHRGRYIFKNAKSGKALSVKGDSRKSGANVLQRTADDRKGQAWKFVPTSQYSVSGDASLDRGLADILRQGDSLRAAFDFVRDRCSWADPDTAYRSGRYMSDYNTKRYAKEMMSTRSGSCYCSSSLFMWLARALGYGANVTVGYLQSNIPGVIGAHSWVEVYQGGKTYVCDPDCERGYRYRDWYMKSYATTPAEYHFW